MDLLLRQIQDHASAVVLVLILATAGLFVMSLSLMRQNMQLRKRWSALLEGASGRNLEVILQDHLKERMNLANKVNDIGSRTDSLEKRMDTAKRFVGLVHYDAFPDVGGSQSFSLALYDDQGDGTILTCLYGRTECRIYSKLLEKGKPDRGLTGEEARALELASGSSRAVRVR